MGKGNELWDDSALTKAFDHAMATFKEVHSSNNLGDKLKEGTYMSDSNEKDIVLIENTTGHAEAENDKNISSNTTETSLPNDYNKMPLEGKSSQENNFTDGNNYIFSDQQNMAYTQLLNQYYELENQKQKIVEQLNQANYWNYQTPVQNSTTQAPQVSEYATYGHGVQASYQSCSCHCVAVPLISSACSRCCPTQLPHSSHFSCGQNANATAVIDSVYSINDLKENDGAIKAGIQAAESIKNSMNVEATTSFKGDEEKVENDTSSEPDQTDLLTVLNAWYTAGLYTGRYLSEQSKKNGHR